MSSDLITQLQNLWILYYIRTHYSSILFRSLHYTTDPVWSFWL